MTHSEPYQCSLNIIYFFFFFFFSQSNRQTFRYAVTTTRWRTVLVSFCVISFCLFMTSDCSLTHLTFFLLFFHLVWLIYDHHSFVHCLSEPKPSTHLLSFSSQSSVDDKEFKRCGPFDPYINAKVCTQSCQKHFFLNCFFAWLLCWLAALRVWFVAAAQGGSWGASLLQSN